MVEEKEPWVKANRAIPDSVRKSKKDRKVWVWSDLREFTLKYICTYEPSVEFRYTPANPRSEISCQTWKDWGKISKAERTIRVKRHAIWSRTMLKFWHFLKHNEVLTQPLRRCHRERYSSRFDRFYKRANCHFCTLQRNGVSQAAWFDSKGGWLEGKQIF